MMTGKKSTAPAAQTHEPQPPLGTLDAHLKLCRVDRAWALMGGPDAIDWTGVTVGQLDTGYTCHPAFGAPAGTWVQLQQARTFFGTDTTPHGAGGLDPLTGPNGGHGTGTGSTIVGADVAAGFHGVAPRAPLVPVRVCNFVVIDLLEAPFVQGLNYLVNEVRANVVNISLGGFVLPGTPGALRAIDNAYDKGTIVVCAAGNTPFPPTVLTPARLRRTLAVAGVDSKGAPWSGGSFGDTVDLSAPAAAVRHGLARDDGTFGYDQGQGTSFAAAMVSGVAALWLARHRDRLARLYPEPWQRVEAFRRVVVVSSFVPAGAAWKAGFGAGVLDAAGAMDAGLLPTAAALTADAPNG